MKKLILISLFLILIISGCKLIGRGEGKGPEAHISEEEIRIGNEGIYMSFIDNAPPAEVYDSEVFPVIINFENKGASDAEGSILIQLDDNLKLDDGRLKESFKLEGKSVGNPEGEKETIRASINPYLFEDTEIMTRLVRVIANYQYQTNAIANVCIDTDPFGEVEVGGIQKACEVEDIMLDKGQGAPIAVTRIEPMMMGSSTKITPKFRIYIENVGGGEPSSTDNKPNVVKIKAYLSEEELICDDEELNIDKRESIACSLSEGISKKQESYTSLISIKLDYNYKNTINKEIQIKSKKI